MKKYKLIKEYNGSPKLNTEIVETMIIGSRPKFKTFTISGHDKNCDIGKFRLDNPEISPEFWQEVVEKDYEILYLKCKYSSPSYSPDDIIKHDINCDYYNYYKMTACFDIYSVKRLSDGKIFTVGDEIVFLAEKPHMNHTSSIKSFKIEQNTIYISNPGCLIGSLKNIKHIKKPLFTTEDNYKIYPGDSYWCVNTAPHLWSIFSQTAKENTKLNKGVLAFKSADLAQKYVKNNKPKKLFTTEDGVDIFEGDDVWGVTVNDFKVFSGTTRYNNNFHTEIWKHGKFSTKQAAEEYILMNKPCLSINDVMDSNDENNKLALEELKKLVKSKNID